DSLEFLDHMQLITERMTERIEPCHTVEPDGIDNQSVAIPLRDGVTVPSRIDFLGMWTAVGRNRVKPGVLLKQKSDRVIVLHDLNRIRRVDASHETERQAVAGIVALRGVVGVPSSETDRGEWKLRRALLAVRALGEIRDEGMLPDAAHVRLAVLKAR